MASDAGNEQRAKLLAKLNWLIERSKVDYKGNPPPFATERTLRSVERARAQRVHALAGDSEFLPSTHPPVPLAATATPLRHLRDVDQSKFDTTHASTRSRRGADDEAATSARTALCWHNNDNNNSNNSSDSTARQSRERTWCASAPAAVSAPPCADMNVHSLSGRPRHERAAMLRAAMLAHPRFTRHSASYHAQRWGAASQQAAMPATSTPATTRARVRDKMACCTR